MRLYLRFYERVKNRNNIGENMYHKRYRVVLTGFLLVLVIGACGKEKVAEGEKLTKPTPEMQSPQKQYDSNSWKSMIPESCKSFYDGCNQCRRAKDGDMAACTKKMCMQYQEPKCLDSETLSAAQTTPLPIRKAEYHCNEGSFKVFWGEYRQDDQRMKLADNKVMFSDAQTHTVSMLTREETGSGMKYSGGNIVFWAKGAEAMVSIDNKRTYNNCREVAAL